MQIVKDNTEDVDAKAPDPRRFGAFAAALAASPHEQKKQNSLTKTAGTIKSYSEVDSCIHRQNTSWHKKS